MARYQVERDVAAQMRTLLWGNGDGAEIARETLDGERCRGQQLADRETAGGKKNGSRQHPIPRGGASTVAVLQALLAEDPAAAFARADLDGSGDLTLDEWERAFGAEEGVDAGALRALFHDFDADQDGRVSLAEFQAGLQAARPSAGGLDVLRGFVRNLELEGLLASRLAVQLQARRPADEKELPLDAAAIATHWQPGDARAAWQDKGLEDEVARALEAQVSRLQRQLAQGAALDAAQMNAKFAGSTFEGDYGDLQEHVDGVEKKIGLPALKIWEAMKMQCNGAGDSQRPFPVPNNGVKEATPAEEWEYVVTPDLAKVYPGGRRGVLLDVFNVAHGAAQRDGGARLDMPLDAPDALEDVAQRNKCSVAQLVDSVKTVALRSGKASFLSEEPLERAIKKLTSESVADELNEELKALEQLKEELDRFQEKDLSDPEVARFAVGKMVMVTKAVMTDKGHEVPRDTRGEVREIDDDGDALVQFEGADFPHRVSQSDFDKLVLSKETALNLERDMEKLKGEISDHTCRTAKTIARLEELLKLGTNTLEELRRQLGEALEKAPRVETTGERSFAAVAESVQDLASREMLEALVWYARSNLMEAKVCEEEIIGLRLYSGASSLCLARTRSPALPWRTRWLAHVLALQYTRAHAYVGAPPPTHPRAHTHMRTHTVHTCRAAICQG